MNNFTIVKPDPNDDRSDGMNPNNEQYHHNQENHYNQTHK